ncbi:MAG TPA: hypothetical protein VFD84_04470 [Candidatus Binatia bacterium]|nr:hypothetical protein [Candidatus Binatia bacterium]
MMGTRLYAIGLTLSTLTLLVPSRAAAQSTDLDSYALFAIQEIRAKGLKVVGGGDVGVNNPDGELRVHSRLDAPGSEISADTVRTLSAASCATLFANSAHPTICTFQHPFVTPFPNLADLRTACGFPDPFPACGVNGPNFVVNRGETLVLPPGTYGTVEVKGSPNAGVLVFDGIGDYDFCSLTIGRKAQLLFRSAVQGPVNVHVTGDVTGDDVDPQLGNGSFTGPEAGSALSPSDIHLFANGALVNFSRRSKVKLNLCAPNAMMSVTQGAQLTGTFVAASIHTEHVTVISAPASTSTTTTTSTTSSTTAPPDGSTTSTTTTVTSSSTSSTEVVATTTTTNQNACQEGHCGDGVVDPQCDESCECALVGQVRPTSCSGAMIEAPHDLPACAVCKSCVLDQSQCAAESTTTTTVPDGSSSTTTTTMPAETSTTTTTEPGATTTTTTTTPGTCGNGHLDPGEECDGNDLGGAQCPVGSPIGALLCSPNCTIDSSDCHSSTTTTTEPALRVKEICGNCLDDDGNGLTDFEDPACCAQLQQFAMDRVRSTLKPKRGVSNFLLHSRLASAGLGSHVNPMMMGQDVFVQVRPTSSRDDILCAWIPAKKFMGKHKKFTFWDRNRRVKSAKGLSDMTLIVGKKGRLRLRTHGPRVQMESPGATTVRVTVGFHSHQGDDQNLCSSTMVPLKANAKGALRTP